MPVTSRPAAAADAAGIAALHTASWRSTYRGILSEAFLDGDIVANRLSLWEGRLAANGDMANMVVKVAEQDGKPIGFVCAILDEDPTWGAMIDNLHVLPACKGMGVGRALMHEAAAWVQHERPASRLHLWVYEQNHEARRFYERLGAATITRVV